MPGANECCELVFETASFVAGPVVDPPAGQNALHGVLFLSAEYRPPGQGGGTAVQGGAAAGTGRGPRIVLRCAAGGTSGPCPADGAAAGGAAAPAATARPLPR